MNLSKLSGKGKGSRFLALTVSAAMAVSLAACGNKGEAETANEPVKEFTYVPEYISLTGDNPNSGYEYMTLVGNNLYYSEYSWNEETGESANVIKEYSLADGTSKEIPFEKAENQSLSNMAVDSEKNFYFLLSVWPEEPDANGEYHSQTFYKKCDAQGNVLTEQEITDAFRKDGEEMWPQNMAADGEGNLYISTDRGILLLDSTGADAGMISTDRWIDSMTPGKDGKVYITYYDYTSANGGTILSDIDFAGKKLGNTYQNVPGSNLRSMCPGSEKTFLLNDGITVYEYDTATQTYEESFTWLDSDINGGYVRYIALAEDGKILAMIEDWGSGVKELAKMTKTKTSELPQKEQVVIGTLYTNQELQAAAVNFNKQSDKYHISIKNYIDTNNWTETTYSDGLAKLNNDITSGKNCPDILDVGDLNEAQLTAKDLFEDLYPYMENSTVLKKEDFVDGILEPFTHDGKLYSVPKTFSLSTLVGKSSIVGDKMGWSVDDMIACAKEYPDAVLFEGMQKDTAMLYCMMFNQDFFVDWEKAECRFDTDEFKKILEFVNMFPSEIDWNNYDFSETVEKLQNNEILLDPVNISQIEDVQMYPARFGEDVTFVGFPVMDDGVGCMLQANTRFGITSKSQHKEGAWAFIENYMTEDSGDMFSWGFSTLKDKFQKKIDEAIKQNEATENGEGTSMSVSSISMDGWEYTYHAPTEEEIELVKDLIAVARPAATTNDEIIKIIQEEAAPYFEGQKSIDEVAGVIQSRAQIYVSENS